MRYAAAVTLADAPSLRLNAEEVVQGGALIAVLEGGADYVEYSVYLPHLDRWIPLCECFGKRVAVLPAGLVCDVGEHWAELYRTGASDLPTGDEKEPVKLSESGFRVTAASFERQDLVTTEETQSIYTSSNNQHDTEKLRSARVTMTPHPYFDRDFILPLEGRRTTEFGMQRYVNGKLQSRHTGYDIGASEGTEIRAAASGVVTMAEELIVYGNTVVIDHGLGIYTNYSHMSTIFVDEGDYVEQGAVIGLVGTTGYSTGPHLHYTLTVQTYYTDPEFACTLFDSLIEIGNEN